MSAEIYTLNKSNPARVKIYGETVNVYNLKWLGKNRDLDPMNWWSPEDKRDGALMNARVERARSNTFNEEMIFFAIDLHLTNVGEHITIYRAKPHEVKTWVDWSDIPGDEVGSLFHRSMRGLKFTYDPNAEFNAAMQQKINEGPEFSVCDAFPNRAQVRTEQQYAEVVEVAIEFRGKAESAEKKLAEIKAYIGSDNVDPAKKLEVIAALIG